MTERHDIDRTVQAWFAVDAPHAAPPRLVEAVVTDTRRRRPRPAWLVVLRGDDAAASFPNVSFLSRPIVGIALAALLMLGLISWAVVAGGAPRPISLVLPTSTPAMTIATTSPAPTVAFPAPTGPLPPGANVRNGPLAPGKYDYLFIDGQGFSASFTVPSGWTWNGRSLSKGGSGPPGGATIFFYGGSVQVYPDPCHWAAMPTRRPAGSAADVVAALAAQPSRSATTPTDASSQGLANSWPSMVVELTVPDGINFAGCDRGQFRSWGPENNVRSHQGAGQRDLVWAIDIPGAGTTDAQGKLIAPVPPGGLVIDAASFPSTPAEVMSEMARILRSMYVGHFG